jgi:3-oxo-5-alpha-steroid 4-dehydrogenase 1
MSNSYSEFLLTAMLIAAIAVFIFLIYISAPYGRYFKSNFGPTVNGKLGWIIMEAPAPLLFAALLILDTSS